MLSATLHINGHRIDGLQIVRIEGGPGKMCVYRCRWQGEEWTVRHHYNRGAWRLIEKAIQFMPGRAHRPPQNREGAV